MRASDYPAEYREIFEKALQEDVVLTFSTHGKAKAFRTELYYYRYAVRDDLPESKQLYDMLMKVELSIRNRTLTIRRKKSRFLEKLNDTSAT